MKKQEIKAIEEAIIGAITATCDQIKNGTAPEKAHQMINGGIYALRELGNMPVEIEPLEGATEETITTEETVEITIQVPAEVIENGDLEALTKRLAEGIIACMRDDKPIEE